MRKQKKDDREKDDNRIENHHCIPLSMFGWDLPANILRLPRKQHKQIHGSQDVHYQRLRVFRKRTNHLRKDDPRFKAEYLKLLLEFFAGAMLLPAGLIRAQALVIRRMTHLLAKEKDVDKPEDLPREKPLMEHLIYWVVNFITLYGELFLIQQIFFA